MWHAVEYDIIASNTTSNILQPRIMQMDGITCRYLGLTHIVQKSQQSDTKPQPSP